MKKGEKYKAALREMEIRLEKGGEQLDYFDEIDQVRLEEVGERFRSLWESMRTIQYTEKALDNQ